MPVPLEELIDQAIQSWKKAGIPLLPPMNANTIHTTMKAIDREVSGDVLQFYQSWVDSPTTIYMTIAGDCGLLTELSNGIKNMLNGARHLNEN
jgi:hypothetical protein